MVRTRNWIGLAALGMVLFGLESSASAQCMGGSRMPQQRPMMNQMSNGYGMQQMQGGYPSMAQLQQMQMLQQLQALQMQQMQANSMGDDLMASLYAADIRRYQDRIRKLQKQQQQLVGGN